MEAVEGHMEMCKVKLKFDTVCRTRESFAENGEKYNIL